MMNEIKNETSNLEPAIALEEMAASETVAGPEAKIQELETEKNQLLARWHRALADLQNLQKTTVRDRQQAIKEAQQQVLEQFLFPVIDDLDRALIAAGDHGYKSDDPLYHGVHVVLQHALASLRRFGIEPMEAAGKAFDPVYHEAVVKIPVADIPENTILQVVARGYTCEEKTLRPACVVVSKNVNASEEHETA